MPGYSSWNSNRCSYNIKCARNNNRAPNGCLGADPAMNYESELAQLDELSVARMSIGVGSGSDASNGSALWMIDNSPDKDTINPAQVFDNAALVSALTTINVCAEVAPPPPTTKAPTKNPTPAPTKNPTPGPTSKPTPSPTRSPTASPTKSPTPDPTKAPVSFSGNELTPLGGKGGGTGGVDGPEAPYCSEDVVLTTRVGDTDYREVPITIVSQSTTKVTFQISQEWMEDVSYLSTRFRDTTFGLPPCQTFTDVSTSWVSGEFTALCTKSSQLAMVEIWVADSSFDYATDFATLPKCSCDKPAEEMPMVRYMFQLECVSKCVSGCPS
jgi:hypothetical protein